MLVTGAAGGLGAAVVHRFLAGGWRVYAADLTPPAARLERVLAVNVVGTHRVNRAAFPLLHESGGRIIDISSETGWQRALPMNGPYAASKHAVEAYSDALRRAPG